MLTNVFVHSQISNKDIVKECEVLRNDALVS